MLRIGDFNELEVVKETDFGVYLNSDEGEILLPGKYVPEGLKTGDKINVFIYKDSQDRLIATTVTPKAKVGDIAYLEVKDTNRYGAFLDWGLEKDLLVPFGEQKVRMTVGNKYFVKVYLDTETDRITASARINRHLKKDAGDLKEGQEVDLLVYKFTELGASVFINNEHMGMVYKNDIYQKIDVGDSLTGHIAKVREDNKIDVTIREKGFKKVIDSKDIILEKLHDNKGFLPLTDKSSPEAIEKALEMSKSTFKKAVGGLYKQKKIDIMDNGIKLVED
jgi:predicted RNA-binding protein (virulence factor B family)